MVVVVAVGSESDSRRRRLEAGVAAVVAEVAAADAVVVAVAAAAHWTRLDWSGKTVGSAVELCSFPSLDHLLPQRFPWPMRKKT